MSTYAALVKQDGDWWIGWVEEVPGVNAQERTREGLVVSLKAVLQEALEMNRAEAAAPSCAKAATTLGGYWSPSGSVMSPVHWREDTGGDQSPRTVGVCGHRPRA